MGNNFFPDVIDIGNSEYALDLDEATQIRESDLNHEFCRQAELFATYGTAYELALYEVGLRKAELDRLSAHLDHRGRQEAKLAGIKQTEKMADNYVKGHADYEAKTAELLDAQKVTGLLKQAKDAIVQKRDMLIQLGSTQRQERNSDISMKAEHLKNS